jgi:hypothetical protein
MQWTITARGGATVLAVNGFVAAHHVDQLPSTVDGLPGALRSTDRRGCGPIVVDLTAVNGWSPEGEQALGATLSAWADEAPRVILCAPTGPPAIHDPRLAALDRCQDLSQALITCQA